MSRQRRLVVLISGSGTNLQALIDACASNALPRTEISLVFSNRKAAYGLTRATQASPAIPTAYLSLQSYLKTHGSEATRDDYDEVVAWRVRQEKPDLVVLAGWMHILGEKFLDIMDGKKGDASGQEIATRAIPVINLHPALPGAFDGANALQRAYDAFQRGEITKTGVMVHRVVQEVDRGEPVVVRQIEYREGEAQESFEKRLHETEWQVIVEATRKVLEEVAPSADTDGYCS
ncbi:phosphoribosylglycinamide formyltransferase [Gautieria morchelliformis]|nr:phosphoribosylglycinamide formyltransferase [Gautieria morchelliformis]